MQEIEKGIYIDNSYPGVTLGALFLNYGVIMVDAPPHPDDTRAWRTALRGLGSGAGRMLVNLDAHLDRTLGARGMECPVIAHSRTAETINNRPAIFKGMQVETGADWELCDGITGLRWAKPNITFSHQVALEWDEFPVIVEHHPGPEAGAAWVIIPDARVVFVGDAVVVDQPPFLARADLDSWVETLALLSSARYRRYMIISSRGGIVDTQLVRDQRQYLREVQKRIERLANRKAPPEETAQLVPGLLSKLDFPPERTTHYTNRLRYGLYEYYTRHYVSPKEYGDLNNVEKIA